MDNKDKIETLDLLYDIIDRALFKQKSEFGATLKEEVFIQLQAIGMCKNPMPKSQREIELELLGCIPELLSFCYDSGMCRACCRLPSDHQPDCGVSEIEQLHKEWKDGSEKEKV